MGTHQQQTLTVELCKMDPKHSINSYLSMLKCWSQEMTKWRFLVWAVCQGVGHESCLMLGWLNKDRELCPSEGWGRGRNHTDRIVTQPGRGSSCHWLQWVNIDQFHLVNVHAVLHGLSFIIWKQNSHHVFCSPAEYTSPLHGTHDLQMTFKWETPSTFLLGILSLPMKPIINSFNIKCLRQ